MEARPVPPPSWLDRRWRAWGLSLVLHLILLIVLFVFASRPRPEVPAGTVEVAFAGVEVLEETDPDEADPHETVPDEPAAIDFEDFAPLPEPVPLDAPPETFDLVDEPADVLPDAAPVAPSPRLRVPGAAPAPESAPPTTRPAPTAAAPSRAPRPHASPSGGGVLHLVSRPDLRAFYPAAAQRRGIEGTTMVLVRVATTGLVVNATVRRTSGHLMLDLAAVRVARRYRFEPGVSGLAILPVRFRLTDA